MACEQLPPPLLLLLLLLPGSSCRCCYCCCPLLPQHLLPQPLLPQPLLPLGMPWSMPAVYAQFQPDCPAPKLVVRPLLTKSHLTCATRSMAGNVMVRSWFVFCGN